MTNPVNTPREGAHLYVGGLNGQKISFYANDLYSAKQYVEKYFKPNKKNKGLVWVELATEKAPASL